MSAGTCAFADRESIPESTFQHSWRKPVIRLGFAAMLGGEEAALEVALAVSYLFAREVVAEASEFRARRVDISRAPVGLLFEAGHTL